MTASYQKTNRRDQRAELQRTWNVLTGPWTRPDGSTAKPCIKPRAPLAPAEFTPTLFAILRDEDRPELQKYRNHLKRLRRERRKNKA